VRNRLRAPALRVGSRVGPERLHFLFDGRRYAAQVGDCATSALLAAGVRLIGRSVKYRRPRGVFTAGAEEPNALFTVGSPPALIPNVCGAQLLLRPNLVVQSQNRWPSLRIDLASLLQLGGGFLGAGFYYKTFMWPSWRRYERMIRSLAGLGAAPAAATLSAPAIEHLSCDVLIAGGGAAGLAAARAAARAGALTRWGAGIRAGANRRARRQRVDRRDRAGIEPSRRASPDGNDRSGRV